MKMESFKLSNNVDSIEIRNTLYYNKYKYKASFYLENAYRIQYHADAGWSGYGKYASYFTKQADSHDSSHPHLVIAKKYIDWASTYVMSKQVFTKVSGHQVSAYGNDLASLKEIDSFVPNAIYTLVDLSIPAGVKYFANEPGFKYRAYLKTKKIDPEFRENLISIVNRYNGTSTRIELSNCLWLWANYGSRRTTYGSSSYSDSYIPASSHINYDDPNIHTLLSLILGNYLKSVYKLEKRP